MAPADSCGGDGLAGAARPMLRVLVALLAVAPGRVVPDEALVDGLWGEEWSREREQNLRPVVKTLSGCGGTGLAGIGQLADAADRGSSPGQRAEDELHRLARAAAGAV